MCLWEADSFDDAIALAEEEAAAYASDSDAKYLGLTQAYALVEPPGPDREVFSLIRGSDLPSPEYLNHFFDTGTERQQSTD